MRWPSRGQMVARLRQGLAEAEPREVSEPFQSPFGWHILQVQERRQKDMSDLMLRNEAAQLLRERRFDEELQTWLAELREEAYIEIKPYVPNRGKPQPMTVPCIAYSPGEPAGIGPDLAIALTSEEPR